MSTWHQAAALAGRLAADAGRTLQEVRATAGDIDLAELRARGDAAAEARLRDGLERDVPLDAVLSEEAADDRRRLTADRVWIIDPLDGTREYAEGRDDWAVHVALWSRGELRAGAVALPDAGITLISYPSPSLPPFESGPPRVLVSRSRPPAEAELVRAAVDGKTVAMGSAGAKAMAVVRGMGDVYVHAGGQYEWDSAAPVAVALAAGLHASDLDGNALVYNRESPWQPELLICRSELAESILGALADRVRP